MECRILVVLAVPGALGGTALGQTQRLLALPSGPKILVTVPMGHSCGAEIASNGNAVVKMENPVWEITVRAIVALESDLEIATSEWQRNFLIGRLADVFPDAKEADFNFKSFHPRVRRGRHDGCAPGRSLHVQAGFLSPEQWRLARFDDYAGPSFSGPVSGRGCNVRPARGFHSSS